MVRASVVVLVLGLVCALPLTSLAAQDDQPKGYLGVMIGTEEGSDEIVIKEVVKDGPADKAGLKAGDVILKINKEDVKGLEELVKKIGSFKPNDKVTIVVKRDGKEKEVSVTLGERPKD